MNNKNNNLTFAMIKPSSLRDKNMGGIIEMIEKESFEILGMKMTTLSMEDSSKFYAIHRERPFYNDLCEIMSSGPILAMVLSKENAVSHFRKLIGATNPSEAEEGTIRKKFGKSIDENAIHGSDSDENARNEIAFFFSEREIVNRT